MAECDFCLGRQHPTSAGLLAFYDHSVCMDACEEWHLFCGITETV